MNLRRLRYLAELARLGSMREVADELGTTTSTVSQQLAALAQEVGAELVEPQGRRVRLTPAGRRLAEHAVPILLAVEAARLDLDPGAPPAGTVRVAGFATGVRRSLLPVISSLALTHPAVQVVVQEQEPDDAVALLLSDEVDLALTYDYDLAPRPVAATLDATGLWSWPWALAVPVDAHAPSGGDALSTVRAFQGSAWIGNSRNSADERVIATVASMAGCAASISHRADSLDLVQDLIAAGLGVGLMPADQVVRDGVRLLPLHDPAVTLRAYALTRRGRSRWAPLELVLRRLAPEIRGARPALLSGREPGGGLP